MRRAIVLALVLAGCGKPAPEPRAALMQTIVPVPRDCPCPCTPTPVISPTPTPGSQACSLTSPAQQFDNVQPVPWNPTVFSLANNEIDLYRAATGARRLLLRANYGYAVFDLTNPARPAFLVHHDIHADPAYAKHGDGQSTVNAVQPSDDGQRLLCAYNDFHGTLVMPPSGNKFTFGGDFCPSWTSFGGLAVLKNGSRYIGFSMPKALYVADVTTPLTGAAAKVACSIPRTLVAGAPVTAARGLQAVTAGGHQYLVWSSLNTVVVGEVTITGGLPVTVTISWRTLTMTDLGYPAGSMLSSAVAETHPQTGELNVMVEGQGAGAASLGVNLVGIQPTLTRIIGRWQPPAGSTVTPASALVAGAADLLGLVWERDPAGALRLFGLSSGSWNHDLVGSASPAASGSVNLMRGFRDGSLVNLYYVSGGAVAAQMRCQ